VHISIMMATSMTFGGDSVRYLQPISFVTLLVLALGARVTLGPIRKDKEEAITKEQPTSVQSNPTVQSAVSALFQPALV
jgi:hypothetical protein